MQTLKKKPISKDREAECIDFISSCLDMSLDEYLGYFKDNNAIVRNIIMDFYTLPKTKLHKEFSEKIAGPHRELRIKQEEKYKSDWMTDNVKYAKEDERLEDIIEKDRKYKIIRTLNTPEDVILILGIPYSIQIVGRGYATKFAYTTTISKKAMPNLYTTIKDNMETFRR